jgi:single-strand DNA-binding protein
MTHTGLTVVGRIATDPTFRRTGDGTSVVNFRVASSQRRFDKEKDAWVDGDTLFLPVNCWSRLADSVHGALRKGDPVVVIGRLYTNNWQYEGQPRATVEMRAHAIGPDLSKCGAHLVRNAGEEQAEAA